MDLDTHKSAYDETVMSWLENAIVHAHDNDQSKLLSCLECVRNELIEMRQETELATRP
jgi:hypothetical protein